MVGNGEPLIAAHGHLAVNEQKAVFYSALGLYMPGRTAFSPRPDS